MNKEELLKEFNDKVEELKQELLEKLEQEDKEDKEEKKPFEVELPENGERLHCMSGDKSGSFLLNFNENDDDDVALYLNGMLFETKKETVQHLKEQRLLFKIKKWAEIHNEGWKPDWKDIKQPKW